jgi:hypothetical protein
MSHRETIPYGVQEETGWTCKGKDGSKGTAGDLIRQYAA